MQKGEGPRPPLPPALGPGRSFSASVPQSVIKIIMLLNIKYLRHEEVFVYHHKEDEFISSAEVCVLAYT